MASYKPYTTNNPDVEHLRIMRDMRTEAEDVERRAVMLRSGELRIDIKVSRVKIYQQACDCPHNAFGMGVGKDQYFVNFFPIDPKSKDYVNGNLIEDTEGLFYPKENLLWPHQEKKLRDTNKLIPFFPFTVERILRKGDQTTSLRIVGNSLNSPLYPVGSLPPPFNIFVQLWRWVKRNVLTCEDND